MMVGFRGGSEGVDSDPCQRDMETSGGIKTAYSHRISRVHAGIVIILSVNKESIRNRQPGHFVRILEHEFTYCPCRPRTGTVGP